MTSLLTYRTRSLLFIAVGTCAILSSCSHNTSNGFQGYVEGKFVYVASPQGGRLRICPSVAAKR